MIQIQQVEEKFITDYEVFEQKPKEPGLIRPALTSHKRLIGRLPKSLAADKGYWSEEEFQDLRKRVRVLAIPKKGRCNAWERKREHDPLFRMAQQFRAGVETSRKRGVD